MTDKTKERMYLALLNASALIENHAEVGLEPEDVNEITQEGLEEYAKSFVRASKLIITLANKYKVSNEI